ncbi:MAG: hypothetical protein JWO03_3351 [Bacteroidetes bacterium]|nr:hypothetical protein [Bacteroidota bacterium]
MTILINKLALLFCIIQFKIARMMGNSNLQQLLLEQMVTLHIRLQVAKEQAQNRQLFPSIQNQ